jgi:hypothetical protein
MVARQVPTLSVRVRILGGLLHSLLTLFPYGKTKDFKKMSEELTTEDKIQWLIKNEGCELADGYNGLESFFRYACNMDDEDKILDLIKDGVDFQYEITKAEYDANNEDRDYKVVNIVDSLWDELMKYPAHNIPQDEIKEKWVRKLKELF